MHSGVVRIWGHACVTGRLPRGSAVLRGAQRFGPAFPQGPGGGGQGTTSLVPRRRAGPGGAGQH